MVLRENCSISKLVHTLKVSQKLHVLGDLYGKT